MNPNFSLNSLIAYFQTLPKLTEKQTMILNAILELSAATDEQIADHLGIGINNVSNRVGELIKKGLLTTTQMVNKRHKIVRVSRLNPDYKRFATNRTIEQMNLSQAQQSLPKVKYFVRENGVLRQVN